MNARHLIGVGMDGSDGGRRALEWAVRSMTICPMAVIPMPAPDRADAGPAPRH